MVLMELKKNIKKELENAVNEKGRNVSVSREETIGYHKGSITTLVNERNELVRILQVVESLIQAHVKKLEELGVKIQKG